MLPSKLDHGKTCDKGRLSPKNKHSMESPSMNRVYKEARNKIVKLKPSERELVLIWLEKLLEISESQISKSKKMKAILMLAKEVRAIAPVFAHLGTEAKRIMWDERSLFARSGLAGVAVGLVAFGSEAAGVAALGTAIGVPMWVIFGGGSAVVAGLIQEFKQSPRTSKSAN